MNTTLLIIATVIFVIAVLLVCAALWVRSGHFRPSPDKQNQQNALNANLEEVGFAYELNGDYFYSIMNCWQREFGYCRLYDEATPLFNMIIDCEPVTFSYGGKHWLIEFWKGQYGITTGGEIGIYNTERDDINTDKFNGTFYEKIRNDEMLKMSFVLRRNGKVILRRSAVHWWLTAFKLGEFSETAMLTMDAKIIFPNREMRDVFVHGLIELGYRKKEYSIRRNSVLIHYTTPHSPQVESRNRASEALVQQVNSNNCKLYEFSTEKYSDTLDKLEYIKVTAPELYTVFIKSLYARGVYEAFEWIKKWLEGKHPEPDPIPSCPSHSSCLECFPEPSCAPCRSEIRCSTPQND